MYCILVYDISGEEVVKVCHYLRKYLNWKQNSVFEGELTPSQLNEIKEKLKDYVNPNTDSVLIYTTRTKEQINRTLIGIEKKKTSRII